MSSVAVTRRRGLRQAAPWAILVLLAVLPYSTVDIPIVFDGPINSPGTLQLLASCLIFGALATSYDLMFGRTGLLSFGHALFFGSGGYVVVLLLDRTGWPLWWCVPVAVGAAGALAFVIGAVALRTKGIAFAMVTLAIAQVAAITVAGDPAGLTGGEEGIAIDGARLPAALVGVVNTANLYWLALAVAAAIVVAVRQMSASPAGQVLAAVRDDDRRVAVLGLDPYRFRLLAFTASGVMAAAAGAVYALLVGGAAPQTLASELTISVLVMVVLGGPGTRWGPLIGGAVFAYLDHRLTAAGTSQFVASLPAPLRGPLSQPLFILGSVFVIAVIARVPAATRLLRKSTNAD